MAACRRPVDDKEDGEEDGEDEGKDDSEEAEYYAALINEAIDDVAGNKLDYKSLDNIAKTMETYKKTHPVLLAPLLMANKGRTLPAHLFKNLQP